MSFEPINNSQTISNEGRSCIIIYNFSGKELQTVKNFASMLGIKDQIIVSYKNIETVVSDLLENKTLSTEGQGAKSRAILFNAIAPHKLNSFIDNLKKMRISGVLFASVTETSATWTLNEVISNLLAERTALKAGKSTDHTC